MKDKNLLYILGAIVVVGLIMFSGGKKEAGELVNFRTTSDTYGSGGAIAIADTCGDSLTAYGHKSSSTYVCKTSEIILYTNEGYAVCKRPTYPDRIYIKKTSSGAYYEIGDSDAGKVSTSTSSIDASLEVVCSSEPVCEDTIWTPSPSTVCDGDSFTQTSNCGTTRAAIGIQDCSGPVCPTCPTCPICEICETCPVCPTCPICDETCNAVGDSNCDGCMSDLEFLQAVTAWKTQEGC